MSRQGPPVGIIIIVVAVTAAGLLLWMLVRSGDDNAGNAGNAPGAPAPGERVAGGTPGTRQDPGDPGTSGDPGTARPYGGAPSGEAPRLPPGPESTERPGAPKVTDADQARRDSSDRPPSTETVINGVRVRDHRRDRSKPISLPTTRPPPRDRRIAPELTGEITNRIVPIVRDCANANLPPEARGARPRVEGQVVIAIKEKQARVTQAIVELSDVTGGTVDVARRCIEDKAVGLTLPAAAEEDLEDYPIRISYAIPSR
ncbi:MAG TPA: hypothetical protein VNO30_15360 [Kofleriaceae bacterium]|nr:hypothetical protein [Kofleriaceae bacterium]